MPIVCHPRPNRTVKRHFTAKACGRVVCAAVEFGESRQEIRDEIEKCIGDEDARRSRCDCQQLITILTDAAEIILGVIVVVLALRFLPQVLAGFVRAVPLFLPLAARLALPAMRTASLQLPTLGRTLEAEYVVISRALSREAARISGGVP